MIYLSIASLLAGTMLGFLISRQLLKKKFQQQLEEVLGSLKTEGDAKDKELMQLKQSLADTTYRYSELEKDNRSLKQQIDRNKNA